MVAPSPMVLYEDNHCFALNKPAGLLTQGDATGDSTLLDWARDDLKQRYQKPGNVYLGLVHRLDRPVSGVVLLAKTSKAAARLSEQFRFGTTEKTYWAIAEGIWRGEDEGEWRDRLVKDEGRNRGEVIEEDEDETEGKEKGKDARLSYRVLERRAGRVWFELRPKTGRSHQLRLQLASRGLPICGDAKYGAKSRLRALDGGFRIALHAVKLVASHPTTKEPLRMEAPLFEDWPR